MDKEQVIGTLLLLGWTNQTPQGFTYNDVVHFNPPKGGSLYFYPDRYETKRGDWLACRKRFRALRDGSDIADRFDTDSLADAINWLED